MLLGPGKRDVAHGGTASGHTARIVRVDFGKHRRPGAFRMHPAVLVPDKLVRFYGLGCQKASEADVEEEASQDAAAYPAPAPEQEVVESVVGHVNGPTTHLTFRADIGRTRRGARL